MTNEEQLELIAQARESLTKQKTEIQSWLDDTDEIWTSQEAKDRAVNHLRAVDTHLAEIDEWSRFVNVVEAREAAHPDYIAKFPSIVDTARTQKLMLVTKAERLLGVK